MKKPIEPDAEENWIFESAENDITFNVELSFLDIVSAGFGGAIFLLIIFATLPVQSPESGASASRFIDLRLEINNPFALMEIQTFVNGKLSFRSRGIGIEIHPLTGKVWSATRLPAAQIIASLLDNSKKYGKAINLLNSQGARIISLRFLDPDPGVWSFKVNSFAHFPRKLGGQYPQFQATVNLRTELNDIAASWNINISGNPSSQLVDLMVKDDQKICLIIQPTKEKC